MDWFERRKYARTLNNFKIKIRLARTSKEVEGVTQNLSQGGAFFRSSSWPAMQKNEQGEMRLFLPPASHFLVQLNPSSELFSFINTPTC